MDSPHVLETPEDLPPGIEVDLQADGLLWLVNAAVFHPRGFALAMHPDQPGVFRLLGDGLEAWGFLNGPEVDERFNAALALFGRARKANRE